MDDEERILLSALSSISGVGAHLWQEIIKKMGSAKKVYSSTKGDLRGIISNEKIISAILEKEGIDEAEKLFLNHKKKGVKVVSYFDDDYPARLRNINKPPCFLFILGENNLNSKRVVSVIGTRYPSTYGRENTAKFLEGLSEYGVLVISGLAYGIDVIAHKHALKYGMKTAAIIAGGVDRIYPAEHKPIAEEMIKNGGCIVSESPLGTEPEKYLFPARNRIIAGCSDAVLIIEAGHKSGTIITAICANDFNREVFAVPGDVNRSTSIGCNNLIKNNQAQLVTSYEDIVMMMNWKDKIEHTKLKEDKIGVNKIADVEKTRFEYKEENHAGRDKELYDSLNEKERAIVDVLSCGEALFFDEIVSKTHISTQELSFFLLNMEFRDMLINLPGNKYKLKI